MSQLDRDNNIDYVLYELGYKGFPILALHQPFNVVNGMVVDYLHCVLLGVTKMLMEYWFNKTHRSKPYHIGKKVLLLSGLCIHVQFMYVCRLRLPSIMNI